MRKGVRNLFSLFRQRPGYPLQLARHVFFPPAGRTSRACRFEHAHAALLLIALSAAAVSYAFLEAHWGYGFFVAHGDGPT
jgi:hypothetical protein